MPAQITMPQLSDTMSEGTVVKWLKKEGEKVRAGEVIAEVETDKANMEMEAFEGGTLAHIAAQEGDKVAVGATIAFLATGKEDPADVKKQFANGAKSSAAPSAPVAKAPAAPAPKAPAAQPAVQTGGVATIERASRDEIHEPDHVGHGATREPAHPVPPLPPHNGNGDGEGRTIATPIARRIAKDKGINLMQIEGTGPHGRIVQADVLAFREAPAPKAGGLQSGVAPAPIVPKASPAPIPSGEKRVIPLTKMRTVIAQRLQQSKQTIPHFYETIDVDVEALSSLRAKLNTQLEREKVRLSIGDLIAKGVAVALVRHPALNATFNGTEITEHADVNLGMAVALDGGLIVPVLRSINRLGLKDIRLRSAELIDKARAQKLKQEEMSGATFTVSNLGTFGIREFSAIVNPPEVGILAIGSAEKRAVVVNDQIVARTMMTVTLSADHRVVDGATAADFLRTLKNLLEEPGLMLL